MKLLSFATVTSVGRTRHLGALVSGDADSGEVIDLTAASRALLASEGLDEIGAERITNALCPASTLGFIQGGDRARDLAEKAVAAVLKNGFIEFIDGENPDRMKIEKTTLPVKNNLNLDKFPNYAVFTFNKNFDNCEWQQDYSNYDLNTRELSEIDQIFQTSS